MMNLEKPKWKHQTDKNNGVFILMKGRQLQNPTTNLNLNGESLNISSKDQR